MSSQSELVEAIMELNNMGDDWDAQHIGELIADWHKKHELEARIDALEYAKISPKFKIEERIGALKQELEKL